MVKVGNEVFVTVSSLASFYGLHARAGDRRSVVLESPLGRIEFEGGNRRAWVNGVSVWMHLPVQRVNGEWAITQTDMNKLVDPLLRSHVHLDTRWNGVVVLDPGHGGRDPGALSKRGLLEKTLALDIARRVRMRLANQGYRVFMTRESDRYVPLPMRPRFARERKADLFISIHMNAAENRGAQGVETYVLTAPGYPSSQSKPQRKMHRTIYNGNGHDGANTYLAYALQQAILQRTRGVDRGVRNARFVVLRDVTCPAALVECGFLSNVREESMLRSPHHRDNLAEGIAQGVLRYHDAVKRARIAAQNRPPASMADQLLGSLRPRPSSSAPPIL
jgi:N-acetylmuramoyl-L-alanine amidase